MADLIRVQKFLSNAGVCSRRAAEKLIEQGAVQINGLTAELGSKVDPSQDKVAVHGDIIAGAIPKIYAFHKPRGVVTTLDDPQKRSCVGDYLEHMEYRVYPIGRLDTDVSGLLLLTNDGAFANNLLHPRYAIERRYWAIVSGVLTEKKMRQLVEGIELPDGQGSFAQVELLRETHRTRVLLRQLAPGESLIELVATEGRKHFVKKMLSSIDHPVKLLSRIGFGPYLLASLKEGTIRAERFLPLDAG